MTYRAKIGDMRPAYNRAHQAVIEHCGGVSEITKHAGRHHAVMIEGWRVLHNAKVIIGNSQWSHVEFSDEQDYIWFMLRWS